MRVAELYLLENAQKGLKVQGAMMLAADVLTKEYILGVKRKLVTLGSRGSDQIPKIDSPAHLPLLTENNPMATLYMEKAHKTAIDGAVAMLHRSRQEVRVVRGRQQEKVPCLKCNECRLKWKTCLPQWAHY